MNLRSPVLINILDLVYTAHWFYIDWCLWLARILHVNEILSFILYAMYPLLVHHDILIHPNPEDTFWKSIVKSRFSWF